MAIKNEINKIIDFEFSDEKLGISYKIRSHITGIGATISISPDNGKKWVAFPAAMFSDVFEFLTKEGVFSPISNFSQDTNELQATNISSSVPPNMIDHSPMANQYSGAAQPHYALPGTLDEGGIEKIGPDAQAPSSDTPEDLKDQVKKRMELLKKGKDEAKTIKRT